MIQEYDYASDEKKCIEKLGWDEYTSKYRYKQKHLRDLVSTQDLLIFMIALEEGVTNMANETTITGKLTKKVQKTAKNGSKYFLMTFLKADQSSIQASFWDEAGADAKEGQVYQIKYTSKNVGNKTYHNIQNMEPVDEQIKSPKKKSSDSKSFVDADDYEAKNQKNMNLAGCRNNAAQVLSAYVQASEDPLGAVTKIMEQDMLTKLTKTFYKEDEAMRKELI